MSAPTADQVAQTVQAYDPLYRRLHLITGPQPLLLAHYTSVQAVEQILKSNEVWLSNPLYMNDLQEMRWGILLGAQLFPEYAKMATQNHGDRTRVLVACYNHYLAYLQTETAIDTYTFCFCKHEHGNTDGLLSMWREYGSNGNGAALVFNVQKVTFHPQHPLLIAEVIYANDQEREQRLRDHLNAWAQLTLTLNLPDPMLHLAAHGCFHFLKLVALTSKHRGFQEENEVRIIYYPERDPRGYLKPNLDYHLGTRGLEPKLKYKFDTILHTTDGKQSGEDIPVGSFMDLISAILLGPTVSSPLAKASFIRMLRNSGMQQLEDRVYPSTIPLRPTFQI